MDVDKSCKTCQFNYQNFCTNVYSKGPITDFELQRNCWDISFKYYIKLMDKIKNKDLKIYDDILVGLSFKKALKILKEKYD